MGETAGPCLSSYPNFKRSLRGSQFRCLFPSLRDRIEKVMELIGSTKLKEFDERWANFYAKADVYHEQINEYHGEQLKIFTDAIMSSSEEKEITPPVDIDLEFELSKYPVFEESLSRRAYHPSVLSRETAKRGIRSVPSSKIAELDERWRNLIQKILEQVNQDMDLLLSEQHKSLTDALACLESSSN